MAVTDAAILKVKEMIVSGELRPGERLPPEKELGERLGLSRSSLREAVKALEVIRVLDVRQGDGTYVTSLEPDLLLEAMSFVVDLHDDGRVLEIFGVRRILESAAAGIAATRMSEDREEALRTLVDAVDEDTPVEDLVQHDVEFHHAIAETAGNPYLTSLIDGLSSDTMRARVWRGLTEESAVSRTLAEHRNILDALARRDAALSEALMAVHVGGVEHWLRTAL